MKPEPEGTAVLKLWHSPLTKLTYTQDGYLTNDRNGILIDLPFYLWQIKVR